jgi:hypothetical protein
MDVSTITTAITGAVASASSVGLVVAGGVAALVVIGLVIGVIRKLG